MDGETRPTSIKFIDAKGGTILTVNYHEWIAEMYELMKGKIKELGIVYTTMEQQSPDPLMELRVWVSSLAERLKMHEDLDKELFKNDPIDEILEKYKPGKVVKVCDWHYQEYFYDIQTLCKWIREKKG